MKKKGILVVASLLLVVALIIGGCAKAPTTPTTPTATKPTATTPTATTPKPTTTAPSPTAPAEVFNWRMASISPAGHIVKQHEMWFINLVKERTNGRINITHFTAGELLEVADVLEGVGRGTAEIGSSYMAYNVGLLPYGDVVGNMPMSWRNFGERWQAFHLTGLEALHERELATVNVKYLTQYINGPFGLLTNKPVRTLDDIKELRVRTSGIMLKLLEAFGGAGVFIPMGEVYMALQLGTIDGVITAYDSHYSMKLYEVAKYMMQPPVLATHVLEIYMNMDAWNELPDDLKAILKWCAASFENYMEANWIVQEAKLTEALKAEGVEFITLSQADIDRLTQTAIGLWDSNVASKDAVAAEAVAMLKDYLKSVGAIK